MQDIFTIGIKILKKIILSYRIDIHRTKSSFTKMEYHIRLVVYTEWQDVITDKVEEFHGLTGDST